MGSAATFDRAFLQTIPRLLRPCQGPRPKHNPILKMRQTGQGFWHDGSGSTGHVFQNWLGGQAETCFIDMSFETPSIASSLRVLTRQCSEGVSMKSRNGHLFVLTFITVAFRPYDKIQYAYRSVVMLIVSDDESLTRRCDRAGARKYALSARVAHHARAALATRPRALPIARLQSSSG